MNFSLLRFFKRENFFKREKAEPSASATAVAPRPPVEKPASERFGKTVMPNAARVMEPDSGGLAPIGPKSFSLGENRGRMAAPRVAPRSAPLAPRTIALQLTELLAQIPPELLNTAEIDPEHRVIFSASELERGMANGRPTVLLRSIYQQAPAIFTREVDASDTREIAPPFQKVLEQFASLQVRADQEPDDAVPQVETPFLKVTIEDGKKFGAPIPAARVATAAPVAPVAAKSTAAAKTPGRAPIRLSLPAEMGAPATLPVVAKLLPNGAGVPITERVPASSGPSVPISMPAASAPAARIPFKVTPPASDLCPPPAVPLRPAASSRAPVAFSNAGPRVRLSLRAVLRGIPPFQCTGPIDAVPEDAKIELPFAIVETQLSLGRVAISPAQFQAAMPEQYRSLYKMDEGGVPVSLPLAEILQNLPNESLQLRVDQEDAEVAQLFETPFSQKAAEDAARMKIPSGPIAKPEPVVAGGVDPGRALSPEAAVASTSIPPGSTPPATTSAPARTALQVALDTDDLLDAKSVVTHACRLSGVSACAIVFSDGLSLAGNIPDVYEADALCAIAPEIVKRIDEQMNNANLGALRGITVFCAKAPVSFFAHGNICLAALHSTGEIAAEIRDRLGRTTQELARMYASSPAG